MRKRMIAFRLPEEMLQEMKRVAADDKTTMTALVEEGVIKELLMRKFEKTKGNDEELKKYASRISSIGIRFALNSFLSSFSSLLSLPLKSSPSLRREGEKTAGNVYTRVYTKPTKSKFVKQYREAVDSGASPTTFSPEILYGKYLSIKRENSGSFGVSRIDHDLESVRWMLKEYPSWFADDLEATAVAAPAILSKMLDNMHQLKDKGNFSLDSLRRRATVAQWGLDKGILETAIQTQEEEWGD